MRPSRSPLLPLLALILATSTHASIDLFTDRKFVFNFFRYFPKIRNQLSDECVAVSNYFRNHSTENWAVKMVDSNSLIEPGLTSGNLQYLGSFDECIRLRLPESAQIVKRENDTTSAVHAIHSVQYCTVTFPVSMVLSPNEMQLFPPAILGMIPPLAGICVPSACSSQEDIPKILSKFSEMTNRTVSLTNCITENDLRIGNRLKSYHIVIITIFSVILVLCIGGTIVESEFNKLKESNWFKLIYCFSLKRNLSFLFQMTESLPLKKQGKPKQFLALVEKQSPQMQLTDSDSKLQSATGVQPLETAEASTSSASLPNQSTFESPKLVRPQIGCLHGIRFLSFLFILIYHTFTEAQVPSANLLKIIDAERNFTKQLITNASLWVDTFFLLSGFLVAHSMLYQKPKPEQSESQKLLGHILEHPKRLLHRYLRLTPSVACVLMLSILIEPLGSGPVWYQYTAMSQMTCHKNWWGIFLYVNNIFNLNQPNQMPSECLGYLWYLAVDMQFFLISPLLIMFLTHQKFRLQVVGIVINLFAIGASWAITAILMARHGLTPTVLVTVYDLPYINLVYKASYCRIGPYCIGILFAYLLHRQAVAKSSQIRAPLIEEKKPSQLYGLLLLIGSLSIILTVTMLTYPWLQDADYHNAAAIIYGTTHRTVWALGWALLIYSCVNGYMRVLNEFLGYAVFQFLSKLTYQSYLLHSVLISAVTSSVRLKMYYSDFNLVLDVYKYLILTLIVSIGTFLTFERPFINLEQAFVKW